MTDQCDDDLVRQAATVPLNGMLDPINAGVASRIARGEAGVGGPTLLGGVGMALVGLAIGVASAPADRLNASPHPIALRAGLAPSSLLVRADR